MRRYHLISCIKYDMVRVLTSIQFYTGVIGFVCIHLFNIIPELSITNSSPVLYYFSNRTGIGAFEMILLFCMALIYSTSFCTDWNQGYYKYSIIRQTKSSYICSKVIVTVLSTFIACMIGYIVYLVILSFFRPLFPGNAEEWQYYIEGSGAAFAEILASRMPILYYIVDILPEAFMYAFLSVFALYISTKSTNIFIVLSSPIIFYYVYNYLSGTFKFPYIMLWQFMDQGVLFWESWYLNIIATFLYYLIGILLMGYLFSKGVKRRIEDRK